MSANCRNAAAKRADQVSDITVESGAVASRQPRTGPKRTRTAAESRMSGDGGDGGDGHPSQNPLVSNYGFTTGGTVTTVTTVTATGNTSRQTPDSAVSSANRPRMGADRATTRDCVCRSPLETSPVHGAISQTEGTTASGLCLPAPARAMGPRISCRLQPMPEQPPFRCRSPRCGCRPRPRPTSPTGGRTPPPLGRPRCRDQAASTGQRCRHTVQRTGGDLCWVHQHLRAFRASCARAERLWGKPTGGSK